MEARDERIYRHPVIVRVSHWLNVALMTVMLMSGLQIFNAHPALYWGNQSTFDDPWFALAPAQNAEGDIEGVTLLRLFGHRFVFHTTGVLGASVAEGQLTPRGFPEWATIPGPQWLAMGRRWHFFFAWLFVVNGLVYGTYAVLSRHFSRDLLPSGGDLRGIGRTVLDHLRLRFPRGEEAKRYNVLQKLSYAVIAFVVGPLIVLTGLTMSPRIDAGWSFLLDLFGGRQSARSIHFICAFIFLAFVVIHLLMVVLSGPINGIRSMITGRYRIPPAKGTA